MIVSPEVPLAGAGTTEIESVGLSTRVAARALARAEPPAEVACTVSVADASLLPCAAAGSFPADTEAVFVSEPQWTPRVSVTPKVTAALSPAASDGRVHVSDQWSGWPVPDDETIAHCPPGNVGTRV